VVKAKGVLVLLNDDADTIIAGNQGVGFNTWSWVPEPWKKGEGHTADGESTRRVR